MGRGPDRIEAPLIVLAGFLLYTSLFFGIVALDPDPGRDFVAADLLREGKILYRDVTYFFGPLAPWLNSLLLRAFGVSVTVLLLAGALVSAAIVILAHLLAREILPAAPAIAGALIVVAQASYGFNMFCYATPYTFAAAYGLLFSLAVLYASLRAIETGGAAWDCLAGVAAALALASKQEFALIALLALITGLALRVRRAGRRLLRSALASAACYLAVAGGFAAILFRQATLDEFVKCVFPKQAAAWRHFYESVQYWGPNLWTGIRESVTGFLGNFGFVLWASCLVALLRTLAAGERPARRLVVALAAAAPLVIWQARYLWYYPVLLHGIALGFALKEPDRRRRSKVVFLILCAAIFLMRVLPHPATKGYYGLMYFVPSLVIYVYLCSAVAARVFERLFPVKRVESSMTAVFLVCFGAGHFFIVNSRWGRGTESVATERGVVRVEQAEAHKAKVVLEEIRRHSAPGDRILMLPHGCMYYFVTDRRPASSYLAYTYGQILDGEQEQQEISRLKRTPPRLVVIDDFPHAQHVPGPVNTFGAAYNRELSRWIRENYVEVRTITYQGRLVHFLIPL